MDEAELELGLCVHGNEQSPILEGWFTGTMEKPFSHPLEARSLCFRSTDCDLLVLPEFQGARCRSLEPFCTLCGYFKHTLSLATAQDAVQLYQREVAHPACETGSGHPQIRTLLVGSMFCGFPVAGWCPGAHGFLTAFSSSDGDDQFHHTHSKLHVQDTRHYLC